MKALERENIELRQANEILRKASAYFAQAELVLWTSWLLRQKGAAAQHRKSGAVPFTKEFEREAVRLAETSGRTRREVAEDLGVGLSTLTRWISRNRDAAIDDLNWLLRTKIWRQSLNAFVERMRYCGRNARY